MKTAYEFIVVGCGALGSAAAYWLSRMAGSEVLVLEQFRIGHDFGASEDHSRIIRLSYHTPEYTALTPHTYTAWTQSSRSPGSNWCSRLAGWMSLRLDTRISWMDTPIQCDRLESPSTPSIMLR